MGESRQPTGPLDSPKHTCDPPIAGHDDLTDDPPTLVVVWVRVETTQGLVVALAVAVTLATVLTAEASIVQTVIQLQSDVPIVIYWKLV